MRQLSNPTLVEDPMEWSLIEDALLDMLHEARALEDTSTALLRKYERALSLLGVPYDPE